jgi:nicotinate phosphoribosyltransferase
VAKLSEDKSTLPGAKQIFRYPRRDVLARSQESHPDAREALLEPVLIGGELVQDLPTAAAARRHARACLESMPKKLRSQYECDRPWPVELSPELEKLSREVREEITRVAG